MIEQQTLRDIFLMYYGGVAVLNVIACCYLLLRRSNAIAPDVTSPQRLRRWTAALFAVSALSHLWNLPVFLLTDSEQAMLSYLVGGMLDCMTIGPVAIILLLVMLQDRRRPLWPVAVVFVPGIAIMAWSVVTRSFDLLPALYVWFVSLVAGMTVYMVRALRQYGRWLRDNYADLEHKEVWQSIVVLAIILLGLGFYTFDVEGLAYESLIQTIDVVLTGYLLWRVETLSDLHEEDRSAAAEAGERTAAPAGAAPTGYVLGRTVPAGAASAELPLAGAASGDSASADAALAEDGDHPSSIRNNIGPLLKQYCEEQQLYLQYDMSITELARQIGTNRVYLSKHFAMQGTTYNAYINGLRIQYFVRIYREAEQTKQTITVRQLALQCGFRNYGTFSAAFKQNMGMTATEWMSKG